MNGTTVLTEQDVELLRKIEKVLFYYPAMYAREECREGDVKAAFEYMIDNGGSLYHTAVLRRDLRELINRAGG